MNLSQTKFNRSYKNLNRISHTILKKDTSKGMMLKTQKDCEFLASESKFVVWHNASLNLPVVFLKIKLFFNMCCWT